MIRFASSQAKKWSIGPSQKWFICGSALDSDKKVQLASFVSITGATMVKAWSPLVTHVITSTDEQGAARRTLKFLMAILEGKWILKSDWMTACLDAGHVVDEESFEVSSDIHGIVGGPRRSRALVAAKAPKLFEGLNFYFCGQYQAAYKADLQALVQAGGGIILHRKPICKEPEPESGSSLSTRSVKRGHTIVVYNADSSLVGKVDDKLSNIHRPDLEAKLVADSAGAFALRHTWILDSAAGCRLQPMDI